MIDTELLDKARQAVHYARQTADKLSRTKDLGTQLDLAICYNHWHLKAVRLMQELTDDYRDTALYYELTLAFRIAKKAM